MIPLPTVLSTIGCLGALAMLPHVILPAKMCKLFLEEKFPESETTQSQLTLFHFALFTQLFFLAISIVIAGQTCPCLPVAFFFVFIIATRLVHVFMGFKNELIGLAKKPVMLQVIVGCVLILVVLVYTILAMNDPEYLAYAKEMEETAFLKFDDGAGPLVYFLIAMHLFFGLMSSPGICIAQKMIEGYMPHKMPQDKYAAAQMQFYMAFQSREQLFFNILIAALFFMSPNIVPLSIFVIAVGVFFMSFCTYNLVNAEKYGFALPGMLFFLISWAIINGATFMGLLML